MMSNKEPSAMDCYVSGVNDFAEEIIKFLNQEEDK